MLESEREVQQKLNVNQGGNPRLTGTYPRREQQTQKPVTALLTTVLLTDTELVRNFNNLDLHTVTTSTRPKRRLYFVSTH